MCVCVKDFLETEHLEQFVTGEEVGGGFEDGSHGLSQLLMDSLAAAP